MSLDYDSLMYLGKLEEEADVLGHKVKIRTLSIGERLEIAKEQDNLGVISMGINTKLSILARAIVTIDGEDIYTALSPDEDVVKKRRKVLEEKYYLNVINEIYEAYLTLEGKTELAVEELKKKLTSQTNSSD